MLRLLFVSGYRRVPLKDASGQTISPAALMVYIKVSNLKQQPVQSKEEHKVPKVPVIADGQASRSSSEKDIAPPMPRKLTPPILAPIAKQEEDFEDDVQKPQSAWEGTKLPKDGSVKNEEQNLPTTPVWKVKPQENLELQQQPTTPVWKVKPEGNLELQEIQQTTTIILSPPSNENAESQMEGQDPHQLTTPVWKLKPQDNLELQQQPTTPVWKVKPEANHDLQLLQQTTTTTNVSPPSIQEVQGHMFAAQSITTETVTQIRQTKNETASETAAMIDKLQPNRQPESIVPIEISDDSGTSKNSGSSHHSGEEPIIQRVIKSQHGIEEATSTTTAAMEQLQQHLQTDSLPPIGIPRTYSDASDDSTTTKDSGEYHYKEESILQKFSMPHGGVDETMSSTTTNMEQHQPQLQTDSFSLIGIPRTYSEDSDDSTATNDSAEYHSKGEPILQKFTMTQGGINETTSSTRGLMEQDQPLLEIDTLSPIGIPRTYSDDSDDSTTTNDSAEYHFKDEEILRKFTMSPGEINETSFSTTETMQLAKPQKETDSLPEIGTPSAHLDDSNNSTTTNDSVDHHAREEPVIQKVVIARHGTEE